MGNNIMVNHMYNGHTNNTCLHGTHVVQYVHKLLFISYLCARYNSWYQQQIYGSHT